MNNTLCVSLSVSVSHSYSLHPFIPSSPSSSFLRTFISVWTLRIKFANLVGCHWNEMRKVEEPTLINPSVTSTALIASKMENSFGKEMMCMPFKIFVKIKWSKVVTHDSFLGFSPVGWSDLNVGKIKINFSILPMRFQKLTPMLYTTDLEGTIHFYVNLLGFKCNEVNFDWAGPPWKRTVLNSCFPNPMIIFLLPNPISLDLFTLKPMTLWAYGTNWETKFNWLIPWNISNTECMNLPYLIIMAIWFNLDKKPLPNNSSIF